MMLVGSSVVSPIMERCGRKVAHYALTLPTIFIGRVLGGLSFGMLSPLRSILIGEFTSPKNRGAFLTTVALTQAFGIFFVHLIGSLMSWRMTAVVCVTFSIISLVMIFYSPESPSWLAAQGRYDECRQVFKWLRGDGEDEELESMIQARILIRKAKPPETKRTNRFRDMLKTLRKREFYKPITLMQEGWLTYHAIWIPVILINLQYFSVATGMVPLPNVIAGEVFPLEYKSIGGMISIWSAAGFMFLCLKTLPGLIESIGLHGTYVMYAAILFYNLVVIWFLLPETKGRTLQEIEDEFRGRPLAAEEMAARMSIEMDPIVAFKRRESERRCSVPLLS
ncbi:unnamed protein product [Chilo suppressalis]|uniref:Major facilitator superfamily (MFS) profile domain-containing protein n=1 Tax=Chilo suppressalis TaxID=168631 RepID=A0ABN8BBD1_CHISP|nr:unnamed protein product [Chilo suppressalis]